MYSREIEIRKLSSVDVYKLAQVLELNDSWKKLMHIIPKDVCSQTPGDIISYKYNLDHERLIESASSVQKRMSAEILLDEWGTSGRKRPTLGHLLELLVRAELFRAADLIAIDYLKEPPPARPSKGPAAKIDISFPLDSEFINDVEAMLDNGDSPGTETLNDNARPSRLADNNLDYYEKYLPRNKNLSIPPQSNGTCSTIETLVDKSQTQPEILLQNEQPPHSDLMILSQSVSVSEEVIPKLSGLLSAPTISSINNSSNDENQSIDIPLLSAFNTQQSLDEVIPILSALNVNESKEIVQTSENVPSMLSSPSASTISSSRDEDDDDVSAPNLSILDQRSSNNDSSLTNVTANSEDNSLEMSSNDGSPSYDNIPCLSALK